MARPRLTLFGISVLHAAVLIASVIASQTLPRIGSVPDPSTACIWMIDILPYVSCGAEVANGAIGEWFYNFWLTPLFGVAYSVSILQSLLSGDLSGFIRQLPNMALIVLQVVLIAVFVWGGIRRVIRAVAHKA